VGEFVGAPESIFAIAVFMDSLDGWTYFWLTVTVEYPISFIIVNASAPVLPSLVPNVWRSE
jgi:hypothetical protein